MLWHPPLVWFSSTTAFVGIVIFLKFTKCHMATTLAHCRITHTCFHKDYSFVSHQVGSDLNEQAANSDIHMRP